MLKQSINATWRWLLGKQPPVDLDPIHASGRQRTDALFTDLAMLARPVGPTTHAFCDDHNLPVGYLQLYRHCGQITIHRIWTVRPRQGHGSMILTQLCELADRHGVQILLKVAPLGSKPYPFSARQLHEWYHRHGFQGENKLTRWPSPPLAAVVS